MSKYKVYLSEDGSVARTEQEGAIFSRSNLVNTIVVYSPLPSDYLIRAGFTRADGVTPHSQFLYYVGQCEGYSCYEYNLTSYQLGVPGALGLAFDIFKANEDVVLTTATTTVQVGTSFTPVVDEEPIDDAYTFQIATAMEQFQQAVSLANKTVDARPTYNSKNLVESGGVKSAIDDVRGELQEEHNRIYSSIATLYDSKQDNLIAGDGIKIEGNVISAIGGGGSSSGSPTVTYRDSNNGIYFKVSFPQEMTSVRDICNFLYDRGHEYGGNTYAVDECEYYGETVGEDCGIYGQWEGDYPRLYLYLYGNEYQLNEEGFNFGGGSSEGDSDEEEMSYYYCEYDGYVFNLYAPSGLHDAMEVYEWLQRNGHTHSEYLYDVSNCYHDDIQYSAAGIYADGGVVILHDNEQHSDLCQFENFDHFQENP